MMDPVSVGTVVCPQCYGDVGAGEERCPHCNAVISGEGTSLNIARAGRSLRENVVDNPWGVLGVLFLTAGILGLPVLWRSKAFSHASKLLLSVVVVGYSTAILAFLAWFLWKTFRFVSPLFAGI